MPFACTVFTHNLGLCHDLRNCFITDSDFLVGFVLVLIQATHETHNFVQENHKSGDALLSIDDMARFVAVLDQPQILDPANSLFALQRFKRE